MIEFDPDNQGVRIECEIRNLQLVKIVLDIAKSKNFTLSVVTIWYFGGFNIRIIKDVGDKIFSISRMITYSQIESFQGDLFKIEATKCIDGLIKKVSNGF